MVSDISEQMTPKHFSPAIKTLLSFIDFHGNKAIGKGEGVAWGGGTRAGRMGGRQACLDISSGP